MVHAGQGCHAIGVWPLHPEQTGEFILEMLQSASRGRVSIQVSQGTLEKVKQLRRWILRLRYEFEKLHQISPKKDVPVVESYIDVGFPEHRFAEDMEIAPAAASHLDLALVKQVQLSRESTRAPRAPFATVLIRPAGVSQETMRLVSVSLVLRRRMAGVESTVDGWGKRLCGQLKIYSGRPVGKGNFSWPSREGSEFFEAVWIRGFPLFGPLGKHLTG